MRYWSGFATGVYGVALLLFGGLALYVIPNQVALYRDFEASALPPPTMLVMAPAWRWTIAAVSLVAVFALSFAKIKSEGRRTAGLAITAALLLFAVAFTYWASYLPISELAGDISAE